MAQSPQYPRSQSQSVVYMLAMLALISGAVVTAAAALVTFAGTGFLTERGLDAARLSAFTGVAGILLLVLGVLTFVEGICGLVASRNAKRSGAFVALSWVGLIFSLVCLANGFLTSTSWTGYLAALVLNAFAINYGSAVKREGAQQL